MLKLSGNTVVIQKVPIDAHYISGSNKLACMIYALRWLAFNRLQQVTEVQIRIMHLDIFDTTYKTLLLNLGF